MKRPHVRAAIGIAGVESISVRFMIRISGGHRTDNTKFVGHPGNPRQQFTNVYARHIRGDRLEDTSNLGGRIRFGVKGFVLRWAARQEQIEDVLARPKVRSSVELLAAFAALRRIQRASSLHPGRRCEAYRAAKYPASCE